HPAHREHDRRAPHREAGRHPRHLRPRLTGRVHLPGRARHDRRPRPGPHRARSLRGPEDRRSLIGRSSIGWVAGTFARPIGRAGEGSSALATGLTSALVFSCGSRDFVALLYGFSFEVMGSSRRLSSASFSEPSTLPALNTANPT